MHTFKHHQTLCVLLIFITVFSLSNGRPKADQANDDNKETVVEMSVQDSAQPETGPKNQPNDNDPILDVIEEKTGEKEQVVINVHDIGSRAMAEELKRMPYKAGDMEEIMHGGHHVHGEGHEGSQQPVGVGGLDMASVMGGETKKEEETAPSTVDTEALMHQGQGGEHGHNPHQGGHHKAAESDQKVPTAENPEDLIHIRDEEAREEAKNRRSPTAENPEEALHTKIDPRHDSQQSHDNNGEKVGVSVEEVVHGDAHAHDHAEGVTEEYEDEDGIVKTRKVGREITFEDVEGLGLTKEELKGIDLSRLLRRDKAEYNRWKNDQEENKDETFWEQVDNFRRDYFDMMTQQIREMSFGEKDEEYPEWEDSDDDDDEPHPGESRVDHEAEMWGSTRNKKQRKYRTSYTIIHRPKFENNEEL